MKKVNALVLGLAVLLAFGCGGDEKKDDPSPDDSALKTCQLAEASNANTLHKYIYDSNGKLIQISRPTVGAYDNITYNSSGNIIEMKSYHGNNVHHSSTTISYNSNNLPESRLYNNVSGNLSQTSKYYYNSSNELIKITYHQNDTVTANISILSYPATDQVIIKDYAPDPNGGYQFQGTSHIYYDNMKNPLLLLGYVDDNTLISTHNAIKSIHTNHLSNTTNTIDWSYVYNAQGYPVQVIDPATGAVQMTYKYNCQ